MAKCPFCSKVLSDDWVKKEGASLMGKSAKGKAKRRKNAQDAARLRWDKVGGFVNPPPAKKKAKKAKG
jgi:hypothetical protein